MENDLLKILNAEVAGFPSRASGEQGYEYINRVAARYVALERTALVAALANWIQLRLEPKTMVAVDVAGKLCLAELRPELEELLEDVEQGRVFMPFYARPIKAALALI